jgi:5-(carboxyamino)imidazole ribonucleotide synthase
VGLLGGGQLARMLILKGHEMGLQMHVLCQNPSEPAAQVTRHLHLGDPNNSDDVSRFARSLDVLTIESEFHSGQMLQKIQKDTQVRIHPSPALISQWQDRWTQKQWLAKNRIPTADFLNVESRTEFDRACKHFKNKFVLKKRMGGYDGYGTFVIRNEAQALELAKKHDFQKQPCLAEALIAFKRELAVVLVRNADEEIAVLPLVETHQTDNRLDWLRGPVSLPRAKKFLSRLQSCVKKSDHVGALAFEIFDTGRELLVNEIAPRVHNSGHYSLEALSQDQFTLHLRAVTGMDLQTPKALSKAFAMVNLIGGGEEAPAPNETTQGHLHWYGKTESRYGRKMGHLTLIGTSSEHCLQTLMKERKGFKL